MPTRKTLSVLVFLVSINAFNSYLICVLVRITRIACISNQQRVLRARLLAFLGDRHGDVVAGGFEFQNDVHGGNLVLGAKGNGSLAGRKGFGFGRVRGPFLQGLR